MIGNKRENEENNEGDGDGLKVERSSYSSYSYMSRMLIAFCQLGKCKPYNGLMKAIRHLHKSMKFNASMHKNYLQEKSNA